MNVTYDVSIVAPAKGKVFEIKLAEFIVWDENKRVLGGDMYYDRLNFLEQLGKANWTVTENDTTTRMASPPPQTRYLAQHQRHPILRQSHNCLHEKWNERHVSAVLSL